MVFSPRQYQLVRARVRNRDGTEMLKKPSNIYFEVLSNSLLRLKGNLPKPLFEIAEYLYTAFSVPIVPVPQLEAGFLSRYFIGRDCM